MRCITEDPKKRDGVIATLRPDTDSDGWTLLTRQADYSRAISWRVSGHYLTREDGVADIRRQGWQFEG